MLAACSKSHHVAGKDRFFTCKDRESTSICTNVGQRRDGRQRTTTDDDDDDDDDNGWTRTDMDGNDDDGPRMTTDGQRTTKTAEWIGLEDRDCLGLEERGGRGGIGISGFGA